MKILILIFTFLLSFNLFAQNKKISELNELANVSVANDDVFPVVDTSESETKKIRFLELDNRWQLNIATGTTAQYYRGDKTFQDFNTAVRGGAVSATSPINFDSGTGIFSLTTVPLNLGGTNKNITASAGSVAYSDADSFELSSVGTTGQALLSGGTGSPTWFSSTGVVKASSGVLSTSNVNLSSEVTGVLPLANGGTNKNFTAATQSSVIYMDGDSFEATNAGSNGQFLGHSAGVPTWLAQSNIDHGSLGGLADDDHTQYALLAGRSGGQTLNGGTASGDDLTLFSTANGTKGNIFFGSSTYDEVNNRLGIANTNPSHALDITGNLFLRGQGDVRLGDADSSNSASIQAPATIGSDYTLTLPDTDGDANQVLTTDGSGVLSWQSGVLPLIFGSRGTPRDITTSGIVSGSSHMSTTALDQLVFVQGSGGAVDITANPQISNGTIVGQRLRIIGRSDTNTVKLENGTGLEMNGAMFLGASDVVEFLWDGTAWIETFRSI